MGRASAPFRFPLRTSTSRATHGGRGTSQSHTSWLAVLAMRLLLLTWCTVVRLLASTSMLTRSSTTLLLGAELARLAAHMEVAPLRSIARTTCTTTAATITTTAGYP